MMDGTIHGIDDNKNLNQTKKKRKRTTKKPNAISQDARKLGGEKKSLGRNITPSRSKLSGRSGERASKMEFKDSKLQDVKSSSNFSFKNQPQQNNTEFSKKLNKKGT